MVARIILLGLLLCGAPACDFVEQAEKDYKDGLLGDGSMDRRYRTAAECLAANAYMKGLPDDPDAELAGTAAVSADVQLIFCLSFMLSCNDDHHYCTNERFGYMATLPNTRPWDVLDCSDPQNWNIAAARSGTVARGTAACFRATMPAGAVSIRLKITRGDGDLYISRLNETPLVCPLGNCARNASEYNWEFASRRFNLQDDLIPVEQTEAGERTIAVFAKKDTDYEILVE